MTFSTPKGASELFNCFPISLTEIKMKMMHDKPTSLFLYSRMFQTRGLNAGRKASVWHGDSGILSVEPCLKLLVASCG